MGKKKKKSYLPFRLNILFIFVFALFSLLILQLGVVQILNGEEAQKEIKKTIDTNTKLPVPRGLMYDRFGRIVLDNEPVRSITYTPPKGGDTAEKRLEIAEKLANFITIESDEEELLKRVRERDKKEYWFLFNEEDAQSRLTSEEKEELTAGEQYQAMLDKTTSADYNEFDWNDMDLLNVVAIKKELDQAFELSPHVVKNEDVSAEEFAMVAEHLYELPGIDASNDWNRRTVYDDTFKNFLGRISSSNEGIPRDNSDFYLTRGYSRNDRVGLSGLEQQYESELRGLKEEVQYTTDKTGAVVGMQSVVDGQSGNDLILSVDIELQQKVDQIVREELEAAVTESPEKNKFLEDAMVVMMEPKTGEILAISGAHYDRENDEYRDESFRVVYDAHQPGSAIKGSTILAGFESGVINIGESIYDRPIKIAESVKSSWRNLGPTNDIRALEQSSNVYMFHIAMRMAGATYQYGEPLYNFNWDTFQTMRNYFHQFGLGVETGIDLPFESTGVVGTSPMAGNLLDFSIGQYDTYTTLQLAQYVSTIANDGYRVRPRLVKEVRKPEPEKEKLGPVISSFNTEVLNKIQMDDRYISRVQEGFVDVFSKGTAANAWGDRASEYKMAGKTGTAENDIYENRALVGETENLTLVGYSPYDNPEVAFAIVVPRNGQNTGLNPHHTIGKRIMDAYYELKEARAKDGINLDLSSEDNDENEEEITETEAE
ncbi:penicillin-binding transpeptidase domain-containing protein [Aquibacillus koreensis]|uniref:serine-type D-Ala-D-Ala carboxypeptidase n=1 Tax=Aquibacillus koreensis TaxID=279446 RepID=A0A9X4AGF6_9BACI|nr:penicillin-binding transpeptidase domain-containing protein [Aquibacillus koreensis]MCT2537571.1 penicillin-binding transpeptidase domain-containing protein [Aquibacillus koreensis]MDC3419017.1 penicillin-binding transpeptidase domain-containing protein [Aquibacillus koreensis]